MVQQLFKAPHGEIVRYDIVVIADFFQLFVFCPFAVEKFGLVIHGLWIFAKAFHQHLGVLRIAINVEQHGSVAQRLQYRIVHIIRIDNLTQASAGIADKILVLINFAGTINKAWHIKQRADFGIPVLALAALVFSHGNATQCRISRFAKIGGEGTQIVEGDV